MERATRDDAGAPAYLGVDTHSEAHVGVALDGAGRRLGVRSVPNADSGHAELLGWVLGLGALVAAGVEGTGSYGALCSRAS